jgi:rubrerythrin
MIKIEAGQMASAEILNTAIYNEKLAADHYHTMADLCLRAGNQIVADFFKDQADRERGHYNRLLKLKTRRHGSEGPALGENVRWVVTETGAGSQVSPDITVDDALRLVEDREKDAAEFYAVIAGKTTDKVIAGMFKTLADEEARHQYLAKNLRSRMEMKGLVEEVDYVDLGFE